MRHAISPRNMVVNLLLLVCLSAGAAITASAQPTEDTNQLRTKAFDLIAAQKFTEALPLLEKVAAATPNDPDVQRNLGYALLGQAKNTPDAAAAKKLRSRAHYAFAAAKKAGDSSQLVAGLIESIPADGGQDASFGQNQKAEELMQKGEAAFTTGKMEEALKLYQEALKIDPKLYHAALFSGDVYMQMEKLADAEIWYQKAISIDPYKETAYRYSATPLMKQKKYDQARDRYIDAWITEPYSRFSVSGLLQWGQATGTQLGHPKIEPPKITIGADGKANATINIDPLAIDVSLAWASYTLTREAWRKEKFAKAFPGAAYRHTLAEEADALREVVKLAKSTNAKNPNPQIEMIAKLDADGALETFILMAIPDQGIALDHAAYLRANREKMRQYVLKYVIASK